MMLGSSLDLFVSILVLFHVFSTVEMDEIDS